MELVVLALAPFAIALAVPAAMAWGGASPGGRPAPAWRAAAAPVAWAAVVVIGAAFAAARAVSPDGSIPAGGAAAGAAALVGSVGLLAASLHAVARGAGAPPAAGVALAAAVVGLLTATPFYMDSVIEAADPASRGFWVGLTAGASPFLVLVHAAAGIDPLRARLLYDLSVCQFYAFAYPSPGSLALTYAAGAAGFGGAAFLLRTVRGRAAS